MSARDEVSRSATAPVSPGGSSIALPGTGEPPHTTSQVCMGLGGVLIYRWGWGWSGHLDPGWKREEWETVASGGEGVWVHMQNAGPEAG